MTPRTPPPAPPVVIALLGPGQVGMALLRQLSGEAGSLRERGRADLQVVALANSRRMLLAGAMENPVARAHELIEGAGGAGAKGSGASPADLEALAAHLLSAARARGGIPVLVDATAAEAPVALYASWLGRGIHVVTPNKRAGAGPLERRRALEAAARSAGAHWRYEATVGAGLPVIVTLQDLLATGDALLAVEGVLSGSLAWLLHALESGKPGVEALREAGRKGYLEPDPRDDLSGTDVARKLVILAREGGAPLSLEEVEVESLVPEPLRGLSTPDFLARLPEAADALQARIADAVARARAAAGAGGPFRVRHLARWEAGGSAGGRARVGLEALPVQHPLAQLGPTGNAVAFTTRRYQNPPLTIQGPGAGPEVTAAGIFADLLRVVAESRAPGAPR